MNLVGGIMQPMVGFLYQVLCMWLFRRNRSSVRGMVMIWVLLLWMGVLLSVWVELLHVHAIVQWVHQEKVRVMAETEAILSQPIVFSEDNV